MNMIKTFILRILSKEKIVDIQRKLNFYKNYTAFLTNFFVDARLFYRHSAIYNLDTYEKLEARIILRYHSIEKGLIQDNMRPMFAKDKVKDLHRLLCHVIIQNNNNRSQIQVAIKILIRYYYIHKQLNINIESYFSSNQYENYNKRITNSDPGFKGIVEFSKQSFYQPTSHDFFDFSNSRKSIRHFTGDNVSEEVLKKAISLSLNAPSVCNRQASKVYLIDDYDKVQQLLKIQGGFSGFSQQVKQLLIVTCDRSSFYTLGERNQFYIDGGIYLLNLLYSLHYYKIANCPANWGKKVKDEKKAGRIIKIPVSEKIICLVPIGIATDSFKIPLSQRRDIGEVFKKL